MADFEIVILEDNSDSILRQVDEKVDEILERIGAKCTGYAQGKCPVDTGLLRNSLTWALSGGSAKITGYHATNGRVRGSDGKRLRASDQNAGAVGYGTYSGTIGDPNERAVYVGSNVEYAPYVELGTRKTDPHPFLKPAVEDHKAEYKKIATDVLQTVHT